MSKAKIIILSIVSIIGITLGFCFFYDSTDSPGVMLSDKQYPVRGIDISAHNGIIDFNALKRNGIDFVIIKATEGISFKDSKFQENYHKAYKTGLKIGAYHFFRFDTDGMMQALNFLNSIKNKHLDFPLILDVEEWKNNNTIPTEEIATRLQVMINHLESSGYNIMFYSNKDGLNRFILNRFDDYPLWICSFTNPPIAGNWDYWQHSHWGKVTGVYGNVDINTFNGNYLQWQEWLSKHPAKAQ